VNLELEIHPSQTVTAFTTAELGTATNTGFTAFCPINGVFLNVAALLAQHIAIG
tara:strand:+ start:7420 stop:7581 length:162 start_codon:yes stop_codon:yes gene_type:complete